MTTDEKGNLAETVDDTVDETAVDLSSPEKQTPSKEPEMLTKEQAEKLVSERHSKLDKRISELEKAQGKSTKALEAALGRAKAAEDAVVTARKQVEEAERKALGDSPDAITLFEAKVKHKQALDALEDEKRRLATEKAEWEDVITEAKQHKIVKLSEEIASEHEVDPALLVSMTDGSRAKMEALAKVLPKKTPEDKVTIPRPPDSGRKSKALTHPTVEQLEHMTMEEHVAWAAERDKNKR